MLANPLGKKDALGHHVKPQCSDPPESGVVTESQKITYASRTRGKFGQNFWDLGTQLKCLELACKKNRRMKKRCRYGRAGIPALSSNSIVSFAPERVQS